VKQKIFFPQSVDANNDVMFRMWDNDIDNL